MKKLYLPAIVSFLILGFFSFVPAVFAQEAVSINLRPALFEERVEPGGFYSSEIKVVNEGDIAQTLYLVVRDIVGVRDDGRTPVFADDDIERTGLELSSWVSFDEGPHIFMPREEKTIPFSIRFPENISPGGHFAGVFLSNVPDSPEMVGSAVGYNVGAIMNFRVAGDIFEEARIREFRVGKFVYNEPKVNFSVLVENLGNVLIRPQGSIEITGMFGFKSDNVLVNPTVGGVFPGADRRFDVLWEQDGFHLGRYQAVLSMAYGEDERKTMVSTVSFWIIPAKTISIVLGGLILFIVIIAVAVQAYIRNKLKVLAESQKIPLEEIAGPGKPMSRFAIMAIAVIFATLLFISLLFLILA